jgi:hypothetical protein
MMVITNLDEPNVWIHTCKQHVTLFQHVYPWLWRILQLPNIGICFVMPLLREVVMGLKGVFLGDFLGIWKRLWHMSILLMHPY